MIGAPTYVEMLSAFAVREARGAALLDAWAGTTHDAVLARTLSIAAIRSREHAAAFTKRLCELGYPVRTQPDADHASRLAHLRSGARDEEKFATLFGAGACDGDFDGVFDDTTLDATTGALLGRFIAEARDSRRRLDGEYDRVRAGRDADDAAFAALTQRLERLTRTIEELKTLRRHG